MDLIQIQNKIYTIRQQRVMLDYDLAALYEVETRALNQSVKRNLKRFPSDFMFQLTTQDWEAMSSQIVMTFSSKRPKAAIPYAFTEQGLAMLSGILNSDKAIEVNISIMRAFVLIRTLALTYKELSERLKILEDKFPDIYKAINYLLDKDKNEVKQKERTKIGFKK